MPSYVILHAPFAFNDMHFKFEMGTVQASSSWIFITFSYFNILAILAIVLSFSQFLCNGSTLKQKQRELLAEKNGQARQEEVYLSSLDLSRINESKDLPKKSSRWNGKVPMVSCPQNPYMFFADLVVEG